MEDSGRGPAVNLQVINQHRKLIFRIFNESAFFKYFYLMSRSILKTVTRDPHAEANGHQ